MTSLHRTSRTPGTENPAAEIVNVPADFRRASRISPAKATLSRLNTTPETEPENNVSTTATRPPPPNTTNPAHANRRITTSKRSITASPGTMPGA
ncbi:hypothetical protein [Amycolatopsis sp. NPDC102389]|uniref:hypothetical protein n=1 Tax=Amycolatopsis sp. NPDC102389 TaxID=3363941 RepID=UPI003807223B